MPMRWPEQSPLISLPHQTTLAVLLLLALRAAHGAPTADLADVILDDNEAKAYLANTYHDDYSPEYSSLFTARGEEGPTVARVPVGTTPTRTPRYLLTMRSGRHRRRLCGSEGHFWHKTSIFGTGYCEECPKGRLGTSSTKKWADHGLSSCTLCPNGQYSDQNAVKPSTGCKPCSAGKYSTSGTGQTSESVCKPCSAGQYQPQTGASSPCTDCPPGKFQDDTSADACKQCGIGKYSSGTAQSSDATCLPMSNGAATGCPPGKFYQSASGSESGSYWFSTTHTNSSCTFKEGNGASNPATPQIDLGTANTAVECEALVRAQPYPRPNGATWNSNTGNCYAEYGMTSIENPVSDTYRTCQFSTVFACEDCKASLENDGVCVNCPSGKAKSTSQHLPCDELCSHGSYSEAGATSCTQCPGGYWQNEANSSDCVACEAGRYSEDGEGQTSVDTCKPCEGGKYSTDGVGQNSSATCTACPGGKYSVWGEAQTDYTVCESCIKGMFLPEEGANSDKCITCLAGHFANQSGTATCFKCPKGYVLTDEGGETSNQALHDDIVDCKICPTGKYNEFEGSKYECLECKTATTPGSTSCDNCGPGNFVNTSATGNQSACVQCKPGFYTAFPDLESCTICPKGYFDAGENATNGRSVCDLCPEGTRSDVTGALSEQVGCETCSPGTFSRTTKGVVQTSCENCPKGRWSNQEGNRDKSLCKFCNAGRWSDDIGAISSDSCTACQEGKYSSTPGESSISSCKRCPIGYYQNLNASIFCFACLPGSSQDKEGQQECASCSIGMYASLPQQEYCIACRAGRAQNTPTGSAKCSGCRSGLFISFTGADADDFQCLSCEPGMISQAGASICTNCSAGMYQTVGGKSTCISCLRGRYSSRIGQTSLESCEPCAAGKYSTARSATSILTCNSCAAGKFSSTSGANSSDSCTLCVAGKYSLADAVECSECSQGRSSEKGSTVCSTCDAGKFRQDLIENDYSCLPCAPGKVSQAAASECSNCSAGFYQDLSQMSRCKYCLPGRFGRLVGQTSAESCHPCEAGKYSTARSASAISTCNSCPAGKYSKTMGANSSDSCTLCVAGKYSLADAVECSECSQGRSSEKGSTVCSNCDAGKFRQDLIVGNDYSCLPCAPGKVSQAGARNCSNCSAGFFQDLPQTSLCKSCPSGRFGRFAGQSSPTSCQPCDAGMYSTARGASSNATCNACAAGKYSSAVGAANSRVCSLCSKGTFSAPAAISCVLCPAGFVQGTGGSAQCTPCIPGTYQNDVGAHVCKMCNPGLFSDSVNSTECRLPGAGKIAGPSRAAPLPVASGWVATDCSTQKLEGKSVEVCTTSRPCEEGTYEVNHTCLLCPKGWASGKGATLCEGCLEGTYAPTDGSSACFSCNDSEFKYTDEIRSTRCKTCPTGFLSARASCIEATVDSLLPIPENIRVLAVHNGDEYAKIVWDPILATRQQDVVRIEIQWSKVSKFEEAKTDRALIDRVAVGVNSPAPTSVTINLRSRNVSTKANASTRASSAGSAHLSSHVYMPMWQAVFFSRVRAINAEGRTSEWGLTSQDWVVAPLCSSIEYLDVVLFNSSSEDPTEWTCKPCPIGAYCGDDVKWDGIVPLFGNWRVPGPAPQQFLACPFPGACFGAPNPRLENRYFNGTNADNSNGADFAKLRLDESCNILFGFKEGSQLCHTCQFGFKRLGRHRCAACPEGSTNLGLLVLGAFLLLLGIVFVVNMAIADAGKATVSEIVRKIMFNFLQVAALASGFPMRWPAALEALFDFQGAISTAGEHILSPDCTVKEMSSVDLFYYKQYAFAAIPPILFAVVYLVWRTYALVRRVPWRERPVAGTDTPKDKMVVTLCVLLYFFWPTLLGQAFRVFSCRKIGDAGGLYLIADFEEECFVGRHLTIALIMGLGQIALYAIGLPLLTYVFLWRHRHELDKHVVRFRYGLFFAGFRRERYYWECIVALRKEAIVVLGVFGPQMGVGQLAHIALIVILVQMLVQLVGSPYKNTKHHRKLQILDVASLLVCWCTMWSGFFFYRDDFVEHTVALTVLTCAVVVMNAIHMCWLLWNVLAETCYEKRDTKFVKKFMKRSSELLGLMAGTEKNNEGKNRDSIDVVNPAMNQDMVAEIMTHWRSLPKKAENTLYQESSSTVNRTAQKTKTAGEPNVRALEENRHFFAKNLKKGRVAEAAKPCALRAQAQTVPHNNDFWVNESGVPRWSDENDMRDIAVDEVSGYYYYFDEVSGESKWLSEADRCYPEQVEYDGDE